MIRSILLFTFLLVSACSHIGIKSSREHKSTLMKTIEIRFIVLLNRK